MGLNPTLDEFLFAGGYIVIIGLEAVLADYYTHVYSYNECCKRALANASRHVFAFAQKY